MRRASPKRRRDAGVAFGTLFGGIPAQMLECSYDEKLLPQSLGWDRYRFEDAVMFLQVRGIVSVWFGANSVGHVRCRVPDPTYAVA